jgi:hypothetical protein
MNQESTNLDIDTTADRLAVQAPSHRKLGYIETVMALTHRELRGTTQIAHLIHLRGHIEYAQLRLAAKILFGQFSILRCVIKETDGVFFFSEILTFDRIPIRQVVIADPGAWRAILDEETDSPLEQTESLWRLTLISGPGSDDARLVVVGHHAMADWTGLEVLFFRLLSILDRIMSGEPVETVRHDIPRPIDEYLRRPVPPATPAPRSKIQFVQPAPLADRRTRGQSALLDPGQYSQLQQRCAQENVKVHSLLSAALCLTAQALGLVDSPVPVWTPVTLRIFGDLRRKPEHDLSCYISVADTPLDVSSGDIWSIAKDYENKLFRYTRNYCLHRKEVDMRALKSLVNGIKTSRDFLQGFAITNIGDLVLPESSHFTIEDYVSSVNRLAGNFAAAVQVDVFKQKLRYTFIYPEPLWDEATATALCRSFTDRLMSV